MQWLNTIVDELIERHPEGVIVVSSGVSPSGTYHLGTLREVLTAEVLLIELERRGRQSQHLHIVDDLDPFRKVPVGLDSSYEAYLGMPLCDVPAPDGSDRSYADYYLQDLLDAGTKLKLKMEVIRAHEKYRSGAIVPAIETALSNVETIKHILEDVSGRKLDEQWSPVQIIEDGRIKNRKFTGIDMEKKTITYEAVDKIEKTVNYQTGEVKLSWRIDWPARWLQLGVMAEPFGRDHATKGGSYDTGKLIMEQVYGGEAPVPIPYNFINRVGETKKMSKSAGNVVTAAELLSILPPEIVWFFLLRHSPEKQLFFGEGETLLRLFDEYAELLAKTDRNDAEQQLVELCLQSVTEPTVSNIPFSHLVASYQAALKDADKTIEIIKRTEYATTASEQADVIRRELQFIDSWLAAWAPDDLKFELAATVDKQLFSETEQHFFSKLAADIAVAPEGADGSWYHNAMYVYKDELGLAPKEMFQAIYRLVIGKDSGPRAGWFLSILPRDWLLARLTFKV